MVRCMEASLRLRHLFPACLCAVIGLVSFQTLHGEEDTLKLPLELELFAQRAMAPQTARQYSSRQSQLQLLIQAIHTPVDKDGLGIQYDSSYTRTVPEVWRDRKANCLSLTALYVACARKLGYKASYAETLNTQRWRRRGGVIRFERHMVALVRDFPNNDLVADFLPQIQQRWGTYIVKPIPESRFLALFHSNRAVELLEASDFQGALNQADLSLKSDSRSSVGWNIRGVVLRRQGDFVGAEACYRKAFKLDAKDAASIGNLEAILTELGRDSEAARFRQLGMELRQKDPYFQAFLAEEAFSVPDLGEAERRITIALRIQPYEPQFYVIQARLQLATGKLEEAQKSIQEARRWAQPGERERYDNKLAALKQQTGETEHSSTPAKK